MRSTITLTMINKLKRMDIKLKSNEFVEKICAVLSARKAQDIVSVDVREKSSVADYYVIASGRSMAQTRALIEHVEEEMDKIGIAPIRREGIREGRWCVLDYGDVLVHLFNDETRLFYHLEQLWGDDKTTTKY